MWSAAVTSVMDKFGCCIVIVYLPACFYLRLCILRVSVCMSICVSVCVHVRDLVCVFISECVCVCVAVVVKYAREERDVAMTTFRVSQGLGLLVSFIVSIFTRSLVTSLYVALPLHVLGFLGLILTSNELTSRQRSQHRDNARQHSPTTSDSREHSDYHNIGGDA